MKTQYLICSLFLLLISSCKKEKGEQLPPITQEGRNTLGCLVDGKPFVPGETLFGNINPLSCYYYSSTTNYKAGSLFIQGIAVNKEVSGNIFIQRANIFSIGKYSLKSDSCSSNNQCDVAGYYKKNEGTDYVGQGVTYFSTMGELVISKLDTLNKIVAGTFYFSAKSPNGKIREITSGRFDLRIEN